MDMLKLTLEERRLSIDASLEEGLPLVLCSADELKQVILNIVLNASQASADGGTIAISTCAVDGDGRVRLRVVDRGSGIEPAHMRSIFNPFFTTKGAKEGSGLGLSICYMIVKKAGGEIRVRSAPRRGTEIEVTLNVHERAHH
jgi:two-component system NtrC family sensor kinase